MPDFDTRSRYRDAEIVWVRDRRGRDVSVVVPPALREEPLRGVHLRRQGQRLDHLAARYLGDPLGFWRICVANDALVPDALAEAAEIAIPGGPGSRSA